VAKNVSTRQLSREELLAKVTGKDRTGQPQMLQTPPPANAPPGLVGNPPLPSGRLIGVRSAAHLTENERESLTEIGWDDSMPLPANMSEIYAHHKALMDQECAAENLPLPTDPSHKPIDVKVIPYEKATPDQKASLREALELQVENERLAKASASENTRIAALGAGAQAVMDAAKKDAFKVVNDLPQPESPTQTKPQARPQAKPQAKSPDPVVENPIGETGSTGMILDTCPHCQWPMNQVDVPEPEHAEKLAFLHSILGGQCYRKGVELFGGTVVAEFRGLTVKELDLIYAQAHTDFEKGRMTNQLDYWERVNRYRLYLQLASFKSLTEPNGFDHELPEGLSAATNSTATTFWDCDEPPAGETVLPQIGDYIIANVLKSEHVYRIVHMACHHFNRVSAKMEAMADHTDFLKPIAPQS
jgi:hypothetical protein